MDRTTMLETVQNNPKALEAAQQHMGEILTRAAKDSAFRSLLLSDSRAALSQYFGREIPETVNIVFVENQADATVVLPDPVDPNAELSEAELEAVAGGVAPALAYAGYIALGFCIAAIGDALG